MSKIGMIYENWPQARECVRYWKQSHEQNRLLLPPHEVGLATTQHLSGKDTEALTHKTTSHSWLESYSRFNA